MQESGEGIIIHLKKKSDIYSTTTKYHDNYTVVQ